MADEEKESGTDPWSMPESHESGIQSVFDHALKTVTFSNGYKNDGQDSGFKALNSASLANSIAMSGVRAGTKQVVIRGDAVYHFLKNHLVMIDGNDSLYVKGEQSETVEQNTEHIYDSDFLRAVKANDHLRVNGTRDLIVLGASEENYVGTHEVTAPQEFEWKSFEHGFSFTKIDLMGFGLDIHALEVEAYGANVEAGVDTAEGAVFHQELKLHHEKESPLIVRVGVEADVLLRGDVLIDIGTGTPFR